jgi:hypothetical protein
VVVPRPRLLLALLALLVLGWGLRTLWLGGVLRSIEPHFDGRCITVAGVAGPEDLTLHPERQVAYVSSYDRTAVDRGESGAGALYAYGLDRQPGALVNLTPDEDADFRPHGLSLWRGEGGRAHSRPTTWSPSVTTASTSPTTTATPTGCLAPSRTGSSFRSPASSIGMASA